VAADIEEGGGLGFGEGGGREGTPLDTREGEGWWSELLHGPPCVLRGHSTNLVFYNYFNTLRIPNGFQKLSKSIFSIAHRQSLKIKYQFKHHFEYKPYHMPCNSMKLIWRCFSL
jgi:hypothetical protein